MTQRLISRGLTSGRADDNAETIKKRLDSFHAISEPVLARYKGTGLIKAVSAVPAANDVFEAARTLFDPSYVAVSAADVSVDAVLKNPDLLKAKLADAEWRHKAATEVLGSPSSSH